MSNYYKYNFISPEPLFATIKEELKSYFNTDMIDDLLFPVWTNKALRKLSKASLPIQETVLYLEDYSATLPKGFDSIREAWLCTNIAPVSIRKPGACYSQITTLLNPTTDPCEPCNPCETQYKHLIYKTTTDEIFTNKISHLLKPGNISAQKYCGDYCPNPGSDSADIFDIRDGKFHTNFREGDVYLMYYSKEQDENHYPLIPDNEILIEYIDAYIRCKIFEQLMNQVTDETANQMDRKYQIYEQKKNDARSAAHNEMVKETVYKKIEALNRQNNRFNKYIIR